MNDDPPQTISRLAILAAISYCLFTATQLAPAQQPPEACPPVFVVDGWRPFQKLGGSVGTLDDLDGNGLSDVLVSSGGELGVNGPIGDVCVYSGQTQQLLRCWEGEPTAGFAGFGNAANAGDINGDGASDLVVSAAYYNYQAGRVYLYSGNSDELLQVWNSPHVDHWFGFSVSVSPDLDGDDIPDVLVGEPGRNLPDLSFPGQVYVFSGGTGKLVHTWHGNSPADHFGWSVSGGGDLDGDGFGDVIVGALWNDHGKAYVYSGLTGELLWFRPGDPTGGVFGAAVAWIGDLTGDGRDEFAVGDYYHDGPSGPPGSSNGRVYVFGGTPEGLLFSWFGENPSDFFGNALAAAGDVNGDSVPDILVGACSHDGPAGWNSGKAYLYSGKTGSLLWSMTGEAGSDFFGDTVAGAGDTDGDGRAEIVIGAVYHDGSGGNASGRAYLFRPIRESDCDCIVGVGLNDFRSFAYCLSGVGIELQTTSCNCADADADLDVDLADFSRFQSSFVNVP